MIAKLLLIVSKHKQLFTHFHVIRVCSAIKVPGKDLVNMELVQQYNVSSNYAKKTFFGLFITHQSVSSENVLQIIKGL